MRNLAISAAGVLFLMTAPALAQSASSGMAGAGNTAQGATAPSQQGSTTSTVGTSAGGSYNASGDVAPTTDTSATQATPSSTKAKHKKSKSSTSASGDTSSSTGTGATTTTTP